MSREENLMLIGSCKTFPVTVNIFFSTKRLNTKSPFSYPSRALSIIYVASAPLTGQIQSFFVSLLVVHPRPLRPVIAPPYAGLSLHAPHNMVAIRASVPSPDHEQFRPRRHIRARTDRLLSCLAASVGPVPVAPLPPSHTVKPAQALAPHSIVPLCGRITASHSVLLRFAHRLSSRARRRVGRRAGGSLQILQAETSSLRKGARLRRLRTRWVPSASGGTPPNGATRVWYHWPSLASSACCSHRQRRRPTRSAHWPTR